MRKALVITLVSIAFLFMFAGLMFWAQSHFHMSKHAPKTHGQATLPVTQLTIGTTTLQVEMATTEDQEQQGLSGRSGLPVGGGMLFVFDPPRIPGFWMKDMLFPLDIIFINGEGRVVTVHKNVAPETYPAVFRPSAPAHYVLEVPAGFADAHTIAEGAKVVVQ